MTFSRKSTRTERERKAAAIKSLASIRRELRNLPDTHNDPRWNVALERKAIVDISAALIRIIQVLIIPTSRANKSATSCRIITWTS